MASSLVVADDPLFDKHQAPSGHPERPARLTAAREALACLLPARVEKAPSRDADEIALRRVHSDQHTAAIERAAGQQGYFDADTFYVEESVAAARRAAGAGLALVELAVRNDCTRGLALVRPPGHHAGVDRPMGFCLINNIAVAAAHALALGKAKVAIVDFDVHHGNGTQEIFYTTPEVLFISLHQSPCYPGTGKREEQGSGEGLGHTVNIPLSAGAAGDTYRAAFERMVCPVLEQYRPELLLVSAGYDAHANDPLASMMLTAPDYGSLLAELCHAVPRDTPVLVFLEGGYHLEALKDSITSSVAALIGVPSEGSPPARMRPYERLEYLADLEAAREIHRRHWKL